MALKTETCYRFSLKIPHHNTNLICMWIMCVSGDVGGGGEGVGGGGGGEERGVHSKSEVLSLHVHVFVKKQDHSEELCVCAQLQA